MIIGIIGAMDIEIRRMKEHMKKESIQTIAKMKFYSGKIENIEVVICNSFEGKVNAAVCTQLLISEFHVDMVVNIGVAGAVSNELKICDFIVANSAIEFDLDATTLGYEMGYVFGLEKVEMLCDKEISERLQKIAKKYSNTKLGKIATSDKFISDVKITNMLKEKWNVSAVDMETASICHVCELNKIPFGAIRAISDSCNNMEYREFLELSLEKLDKVMYDFIKRLNE
ncbi:MAG: 5'-methylthioadenosine/adenosylhomocysteine nucleosidase [Clostridia bacterium]|nr:5'-methylthioadenosine/adenosylhomocysteine nucleosidase [Clostridia bacterium]